MYMNFKAIEVSLNGSDTTTVVEEQVPTGLSVRGLLIWQIHQVEWFSDQSEADCEIRAALSARTGLVGVPLLGDDGVYAWWARQTKLVTEGIHESLMPFHQPFLPPVPLAAPAISLYARTLADVAALQGTIVRVRIGYTTAPLDANAYLEIAETWS